VERKQAAYAVIRYDAYARVHTDDPAMLIHIVAVVLTAEEAEAEVARLNGLNEAKGQMYFSSYAPYFPEGRKIRQANING